MNSETRANSDAPEHAPLVLAALILVAAVANLNLSVANVALPDIGKALDASQTGLNLVAVGFSLGLATSVLYLGALGDRYGRKLMILLGLGISIPACIAAAAADSVEMLFLARLVGGVAAGMAFPTTLALITALWSGPSRTKSIALWSGIGGAISALGPLVSGALLEKFEWGSVFLITLPLVAVAFALTWKYVPAHIAESSDPVDNLGGILSVLMVASIVLALNFAPVAGRHMLALGLLLIGAAAVVGFAVRQRRAKFPLYDLDVAGRRLFWVAATAGIIVFGSLMAAMFVGQQFLQNVLSYSSLEAGAAILPAAFLMVLVAPRSAQLVAKRGSRFTLLSGYLFCFLGFLWMLIFWEEGISYLHVFIAYGLMGIGVGLAGTPASNSLTGSVPRKRAGMASATGDLQRDLGGAIMQSILGALLTAGYAKTFSEAIAASPDASKVSDSTQAALTKSFGSASNTAEQYPDYSSAIISTAKESFLSGQNWAYTAGIVAVLLGAVIVWRAYPGLEREHELFAEYAAADA
jgi:DHA2 family multidrug resistance protein-like MFS transporter